MYKIIGLLLFFTLSPLYSQIDKQTNGYIPPSDPLVKEKLEKWRDLKLGLMMHWGTYSQWGIVESWSICPEDVGWTKRNNNNYFEYKNAYEKLKETFNPVLFQPEKWATTAEDAGMKYLIFTTKHHDGFCMFDTKTTDYKVTDKNCIFHKNSKADVTQELFTAFRKHNFMIGAYFSKADWHSEYFWNPYFPPIDRNVNYNIYKHPQRWQKFVEFTHTQINEIMSNYGKVDILWLDGGWVRPLDPMEMGISSFIDGMFKERGYTQLHIPQNQDLNMDKIVEDSRKKQPGLLVVDRFVAGSNENYLTPEQYVPKNYLPEPWETCLTMSGSWSYSRDAHYKPVKTLIHTLVDVVAKGGNLLLKLGPDPDGKLDKTAYERMKSLGSWLKVNGNAIYNTRPAPPYREHSLAFTKGKEGKLYVIYLAKKNEKQPPENIIIPLDNSLSIQKITMLGTNTALKWKRTADAMIISIPKNLRMNPPCEYAWSFYLE